MPQSAHAALRCTAALLTPAGSAPATARRHISPELRRQVAELLMRLASKAQFSKVGWVGWVEGAERGVHSEFLSFVC